MTPVRKILAMLDSRERRNLFLLCGAILVMAFLEIIGIGAIGPFMSVAADPSAIQSTPFLARIYDALGFESETRFLVFLGLSVFALIVIANGYTTFVLYWLHRWSSMRSYSIGRRLLSQYLHQPYSYFLEHNTSELSKNILDEVRQVVISAIRPGMEIIARGVVAVSIVTFVFVTEPVIALVTVSILGGAYVLVYSLVRRRLYAIGEEQRRSNAERYKTASEAFTGIKDVKILSKEPIFERVFSKAAQRFAWSSAQKEIISGLPRYIIEAIALGLVLLGVVFLIATGNEFASVIPLISVYAFAGLRLMPALQILFRSLSQFRATIPVVNALYEDVQFGSDHADASRASVHRLLQSAKRRLPFHQTFELRDVEFCYKSSPVPVLSDINLAINRNTTVAFVGPTGCGKTTLIDVMLGLLESEGQLLVDGKAINMSHIRAWQQNFGYVPQHIFLADDTVTHNIAFGVDPAMIDSQSIERAARIAHLHEFVVNDLPAGYETVVGERGIRLSGGQRQRIGIARALYHDPDILVMDEATSALDNLTEEGVMDAIHELMGEKTIIMIAHRITTIEEADVIYLLERGRIVAQGTYTELLKHSERFRSMAKV